jgi:probable F420-dependent oxidoreductase
VKFGLQLPVQAQSTLMAAPWESSAGPAELAAVAAACDVNGFDYVGVCDHVAIPRDLAPRMSTTWYDTVATLAWLAARTERVRLLSHVYVLAYRHSLATAKAFATLDMLSGGRVILGVGAGHAAGEFEALGVPFDQRGTITDQRIVEVRAALRDEWATGDVGQRPRPLQEGGPPIWVGGSSRRAMRRAATLGDGWLPQGPPDGGMGAAISSLREERERAGLVFDGFAVGGGVSFYVGAPSWEVPDWIVTGPPDAISDRIAELGAIGVTHVQVRPQSRTCDEFVDQIAAFGSEIAPLLVDE